ncbi:MAG: dimethylarginine dimethylaminohydrolase family protein [Chthoniobacterales bacterium]
MPNDTSQSEVGWITRLIVKEPRHAFQSQAAIAAQWQALNFTGAPDFARAVGQYENFVALLRHKNREIAFLPPADGTGMDSIYVRDAAVVSDRGVVLCRMGKALRTGEPAAQETAFRALGLTILGAIQPPGKLEGGDVVWLDERTLAVGRGYRTNDSGIAQLREFLGDGIDELIAVPLPHHRGPGDVFHLMSILSPVDRDLAVVYSPRTPVPFREQLLERGFTFVEVPDEEFESMGANVLALAPRHCVLLAGNPITRSRLEAVGAEVSEYEGSEISLKGGGGPTCLTRPLRRQS